MGRIPNQSTVPLQYNLSRRVVRIIAKTDDASLPSYRGHIFGMTNEECFTFAVGLCIVHIRRF